MVAGPSEVLIIADDGANPALPLPTCWPRPSIDAMARCMLVTDSEKIIRKWNTS